MRLLSLVLIVVAGWGVSLAQEPETESVTVKPGQYLLGRVDGKFPDTIEILRDVEIGHVGDRPLKVNIAYPKGATGPMPAVLYVHGGGWRRGSSKIAGQIALLAENGFFAMTVDYRLSGEAKWPAQIEDCKYAVRWLRANAAKYNVDPARIGAWGTSAGGHLVAAMGVMDDKRFDGTSGLNDQSSLVQAVADVSGPTDFTTGSNGITNAKDGASAPILVELLGGTFEEKTDLWKDASPVAHVKAGEPPFLFVHGEADPVVPILHSENLAAALNAAANQTEFLRVKGGGHSLLAAPGQPPATPALPEIYATIMAFFKKTLATP